MFTLVSLILVSTETILYINGHQRLAEGKEFPQSRQKIVYEYGKYNPVHDIAVRPWIFTSENQEADRRKKSWTDKTETSKIRLLKRTNDHRGLLYSNDDQVDGVDNDDISWFIEDFVRRPWRYLPDRREENNKRVSTDERKKALTKHFLTREAKKDNKVHYKETEKDIKGWNGDVDKKGLPWRLRNHGLLAGKTEKDIKGRYGEVDKKGLPWRLRNHGLPAGKTEKNIKGRYGDVDKMGLPWHIRNMDKSVKDNLSWPLRTTGKREKYDERSFTDVGKKELLWLLRATGKRETNVGKKL